MERGREGVKREREGGRGEGGEGKGNQEREMRERKVTNNDGEIRDRCEGERTKESRLKRNERAKQKTRRRT